MTRWIAVLLAVVAVSGATQACAQDAAPGPGAVVITIIPGGATFFTDAKDNPQAPKRRSLRKVPGAAVDSGSRRSTKERGSRWRSE